MGLEVHLWIFGPRAEFGLPRGQMSLRSNHDRLVVGLELAEEARYTYELAWGLRSG